MGELKADFSWVDQALRLKSDHAAQEKVATLCTRLECLQDEVCSINQAQKGLAEMAWVNKALELKADASRVDQALRLKADQGEHQKVATLCTRLECLQDEVCGINQAQKGLAEQAWVNKVLEGKADISWVDQRLRLKGDHEDQDKVAALRTRLECLQDEVCRIDQGHKGLADKAWVNKVLEVKADMSWVDLRLKAGNDQGHMGLKGFAEKAWLVEALKLKADCAWVTDTILVQFKDERQLDSLRMGLECLQKDVSRIDLSLKQSSMNVTLKPNADLEKLSCTVDSLKGTVEALSLGKAPPSGASDHLQPRVHELGMRLHALICALIILYKRGSVVSKRVGGGYVYETGPSDEEAVEALSALIFRNSQMVASLDHEVGLQTSSQSLQNLFPRQYETEAGHPPASPRQAARPRSVPPGSNNQQLRLRRYM